MKTHRFLLLFLIAMLPMALSAHAPKKISLKYDRDAGKLSISIVHPVKDAEDHFIDEIVISVNGEEVEKLEYKTQSSLKKHEVEIDLPDLKTGDQLRVKTFCNKFGSKTGKLEIN